MGAVAALIAATFRSGQFHVTQLELGHVRIVTHGWELSPDWQGALRSYVPAGMTLDFEARP